MTGRVGTYSRHRNTLALLIILAIAIAVAVGWQYVRDDIRGPDTSSTCR